MACPDCDGGVILMLARTRGSLLRRPQKYLKRIICPNCLGSSNPNCDETTYKPGRDREKGNTNELPYLAS